MKNYVSTAIERLKSFEPAEGYYLAFSGGKDSCVIKALSDMASVKYDAHYSQTTIDPPELIYFMRKHHFDVHWEKPEKPFLRLLRTKGAPIRQSRWCCEKYKENGGSGRVVITGIRGAESNQRANRKMVEVCYKDTTKRFVHPIHDWSDHQVWEFIKEYNIPYCELYDQGFKRIGCLFCPLASAKERKKEAERYPGYKRQFIRAFEDLYKLRKEQGKTSVDRWSSGEDMFYWWLLGEDENFERKFQLSLFDN